MPVRRVPKRGFNNRFALTVAAVNVGDLQEWFEAGAEICPDALKTRGVLTSRYDVLKILGDGNYGQKIQGFQLSGSANRLKRRSRRRAGKSSCSKVRLPWSETNKSLLRPKIYDRSLFTRSVEKCKMAAGGIPQQSPLDQDGPLICWKNYASFLRF